MSCPVTFAFSYSRQLDATRLQRSLQQLAECIPWLAGHLRAQADDSFAFEVSGRPRLLLELAQSSKTFAEFSEHDAVQLVKSEDGEPLMHARLTQTPEGSVLAVSMSHALVDGFSFFLAMSKWAAMSRGEATAASPMQRLLRPSEVHVERALRKLGASALLERSGMFWSQPRPAVHKLPAQQRIHLTHAEVAELIAEAQRDVGQKLRQNDVLTAWLWRSYGAQWWSDQPAHADVYMSCPVDMRRQFGEANREAFGCAICGVTTRAEFDEVLHAPIGQLALRIQRSVAGVLADDHARRVAPLEALRRVYGRDALQRIHMLHPSRGMLVTNMSRLPLAKLDFGTGAPSELKLFAEISAMAAVLPAQDGVGVAIYPPTYPTTTGRVSHAGRDVAAPVAAKHVTAWARSSARATRSGSLL